MLQWLIDFWKFKPLDYLKIDEGADDVEDKVDIGQLLTVHKLRKAGIKVRVIHRRVYSKFNLYFAKHENYSVSGLTFPKGDLLAKGGQTTVELSVNNRDYKGIVTCHPNINYCRKEGVKRALARALCSMYGDET